jgi:hypothetical protein
MATFSSLPGPLIKVGIIQIMNLKKLLKGTVLLDIEKTREINT